VGRRPPGEQRQAARGRSLRLLVVVPADSLRSSSRAGRRGGLGASPCPTQALRPVPGWARAREPQLAPKRKRAVADQAAGARPARPGPPVPGSARPQRAASLTRGRLSADLRDHGNPPGEPDAGYQPPPLSSCARGAPAYKPRRMSRTRPGHLVQARGHGPAQDGGAWWAVMGWIVAMTRRGRGAAAGRASRPIRSEAEPRWAWPPGPGPASAEPVALVVARAAPVADAAALLVLAAQLDHHPQPPLRIKLYRLHRRPLDPQQPSPSKSRSGRRAPPPDPCRLATTQRDRVSTTPRGRVPALLGRDHGQGRPEHRSAPVQPGWSTCPRLVIALSPTLRTLEAG